MARKQPSLSEAEILEKVLELLDHAAEPVAITKLSSQLKGPYRQSPQQLGELLERQVVAGRVHRFVPVLRNATRYWARDHAAYARQTYLAALAKKPKTPSEVEKPLDKRLADLSKAQRQAILAELVRDKALYQLPGRGSSKTFRYSVKPPDPREYVHAAATAFRKAIEKLSEKLAACGVSAEATVAAALELTGLSTDRAVRTDVVAKAPAPPRDGAADFPGRFDLAFAEIDRRQGRHNLVSLVDLRRALGEFSRELFDRELRGLRAAGRYGLSAAESVHGVRLEEREAAIEEAGMLLLHVSRKSP